MKKNISIYLEKMLQYWKKFVLDMTVCPLLYSNQRDQYRHKNLHQGLRCKYKEVMLMSTCETMSITGEVNA